MLFLFNNWYHVLKYTNKLTLSLIKQILFAKLTYYNKGKLILLIKIFIKKGLCNPFNNSVLKVLTSDDVIPIIFSCYGDGELMGILTVPSV